MFTHTQDFGENEDKNHSDEQPWLLSSSSYTSITNNANGETSSHTRQTDGETGAKLNEVGEQGRILFQTVRDQDRYDETVDTNNTRHDNGNNVCLTLALFGSVDPARSSRNERSPEAMDDVLLTIRSGRRTPMAETPTPALAVP
jgi:hypothetical protein